MTTTIREFKMVVTERANVTPTSNQSVGTSSTSGRTAFTIQIPVSSDATPTVQSSSVEKQQPAQAHKPV